MYNEGSAINSSPCRKTPDRTGMEWVRSYVEDQIVKRSLEVTAPIISFMQETVKVRRFTVAGGALMKGPINDIDIWPSPWCVEPYQTYIKNKLRGRNFCEEIVGGLKVQLCQAPVCNVEDLVSGFDFAHCKVGASISVDPDGHATALAFVHPDFIASMAVQGTFYSPGHRWPLHSLARLGKVCNKLGLSVVESKDLGNQIMSDLLRGGLEQAANKDPDYIKWLKDYGMPIQSTTPCTTPDTDPAEIDPFSALGAFGQSKTSPRP
jgi:hypothetical protein